MGGLAAHHAPGRMTPYDSALDAAGTGAYQLAMLLVCGLANAADGVEVLAMSFVLPSASDDLGLSSPDKGWLTAMIFVGMMAGSWSWGALADVRGRRPCLALALLINGGAGVASAAAPSFAVLLAFRFLAGFGVGGSIPIVFTYFGEFVPRARRFGYLIYLAMFWMLGSIYSAGTAWAMIPGDGRSMLFGVWDMPSWRAYLVVAALPSLLTATLLAACSESPAFTLSARGDRRGAAVVLARMSRVNARWGGARAAPLAEEDVLAILAATPGSGASPASSGDEEAAADDDGGEEEGVTLLDYGTVPRRPESRTVQARAAACGAATAALARRTAALYRSERDGRAAALLTGVWFTLSFAFYSLSMWQPTYFVEAQKDVSVYATSFYTALSQAPGSLASLYLVRWRGAPATLAVSMCLSAASVFAYLFAEGGEQVVAVSCAFAAVSVGGWNALNIVSTELFDAGVRSTAFGAFAAAGRLGSIAGNLVFAYLISYSPAIPLGIVSAMFLAGGLATLLLPDPASL